MRANGLVVALLLVAVGCKDGAVGPTGPPGPPGSPGTMPLGALNVLAFGAQAHVASFDNTASFQRALDSAATAGGGVVWVPAGPFWFKGNLSVGRNVVLAGAGVGPFDPGEDPATNTVAPTLLATSLAGAAFLSIDGENSAIQDVLIRYPDQVASNAPGVATTGPIVYPPTIVANFPSKIYRCSLENSYIGIEVLIGRVYLENLHLGAYKNDIIIDNAEDVVHLSHIMVSIFGWDRGVAIPSAIDTWVLNNGTALTSYRADALVMNDFFVFFRNTGMALLDSPQGYGATYGVGSDIDFDNVHYGVIAKSVNIVGFEFTNLAIGATAGGVNMFWLPAGGAHTPHIVVEGGASWTPWQKPFEVDAGTLLVRDIVGLTPIGLLPALGLVPPPLPASGASYASAMPTMSRVTISGGSVQDILIGGQPTGLTSGIFEIAPGESIGAVYTSPPAWSWFLE